MPLDPFETEGNLTENLGMFEAATQARPIELVLPTLDVILCAPDGSNQDATARAFAAGLAAVSGAQMVEHAGAKDARDILDACATRGAAVLVLPVPFGRDIGVLRDESLGSVVDMLLIESQCPVFCVRQPMDEAAVRASLRDGLVPFSGDTAETRQAASWALRLLPSGGELELLAVVNQDVLDEARRILGAGLDPAALKVETLRRVMTQEIASLVAACQKQGTAGGLSVHVELRVGRLGEVVAAEENERPRLTIVGAPRDRDSAHHRHAVDEVLSAVGPVLVVGG